MMPTVVLAPAGTQVHTQTCWFNTGAFQLPAKGTFGNVRPDGFQSQRYWTVDFSIFRQFPLWSESRKLEFRAETFNLFNTVGFGTPNNDISGGGFRPCHEYRQLASYHAIWFEGHLLTQKWFRQTRPSQNSGGRFYKTGPSLQDSE